MDMLSQLQEKQLPSQKMSAVCTGGFACCEHKPLLKFIHFFSSGGTLMSQSDLPNSPTVKHNSASRSGLPLAATSRGERTEIEANGKLTWTSPAQGHVLVIESGIFALEMKLEGGRRQILDFLIPGDIFPSAWLRTQPGTDFRALTRGAVQLLELTDADGYNSEVMRAAISDHEANHLVRRNLHGVIAGQLDPDQRVASFLLLSALRLRGYLKDGQILSLPISPSEIADYLALNRDTMLSVMTSFEKLGLVERIDQQHIKLMTIEALAARTPLRQELKTLARPPWRTVDAASLN